jgi:drug/metabolite transporter (DMT)-like permease
MDRQKEADLCAAAAALLWSTVASAFKLSLRHIEVLHLLLFAGAVSVVVLSVLLVAQGKIRLLRETRPRDLGRSALLGLLNPFLYYAVLLEAYDRLPAQQAQPLNYTWAIALAILAVPFLGQRLGIRGALGIALGYSGAWVIATRGDLTGVRLSDPAGVALALGSAVIWALFWIGNVRDGRDEVVKLFLNFACGLVFILAVVLAGPGLRLPAGAGLLGAAYIGTFEMGITFVLWLRALRLTDSAARTGNLIFLSPFLSLLFIHYFVGESIHPATVVGLVLVAAGIGVQRTGGGDRVGA